MDQKIKNLQLNKNNHKKKNLKLNNQINQYNMMKIRIILLMVISKFQTQKIYGDILIVYQDGVIQVKKLKLDMEQFIIQNGQQVKYVSLM